MSIAEERARSSLPPGIFDTLPEIVKKRRSEAIPRL
jgi:hypothetical protein